MGSLSSTQSIPAMIERFVGTEYDNIVKVLDNLESLLKILDYINSPNVNIKALSLTTAERDALTVTDSSHYIIWNETTKTFQGFGDTTWGSLGSSTSSSDGGSSGSSTYMSVVPRQYGDGTNKAFPINTSSYVDPTSLLVIVDGIFQMAGIDYSVGADGSTNQGKLVFTTAPVSGVTIDVLQMSYSSVVLSGAKVTFSASVPTAGVTPWYININTGKKYYAVSGSLANYWVEFSDNGSLI